MKYTTENTDGRILTTSILKGKDVSRRLDCNKIVESENYAHPLIRVHSIDKKMHDDGGTYVLAYKDGEEWTIVAHNFFSSAKLAQQHIPTLHMFYDEIMVLQLLTRPVKVKLQRDDPNDEREETGEI